MTNEKKTHNKNINIKPCALVDKTPHPLQVVGCHLKAWPKSES